jgi:hypothetical protein
MLGTKPNKHCLICNKAFYAPRWLIKQSGAKYCSHPCYWQSKKGNTPWNKGIKGSVKPNAGSFLPQERTFKGTMEEYKALHYWVSKELGKPKKCQLCGIEEKRRYHWANKSHTYKQDLSDWIRLCVPCHIRYDQRKRGYAAA